MIPPLIQSTLEIARSQIGVQETGNTNTGPQVDRYLASVGLDPGNPWCAAFAYWCSTRAAAQANVSNPLPRTGSCEMIRAWAREHDLLRDTPNQGDLFLRVGYVASEGVIRAHHAGFVDEVTAATFTTIEGNSNEEGSSDGYEVAHNIRAVSRGLTFVRWSLLCGQAPTWVLVGPDGRTWWSVPLVDGRAICPVRQWGEQLGFKVEWNAADQAVIFNGQELPAELLFRDGKAWAGVRDLATAAGLKVTPDEAGGRILLSR